MRLKPVLVKNVLYTSMKLLYSDNQVLMKIDSIKTKENKTKVNKASPNFIHIS